jgi:hypothetical protein
MRQKRQKLIFCCECNDKIFCDLKTGKDIYPHRQDLKNKQFWQCPNCKGFVGIHKHSYTKLKPLGCIPTKELKEWRKKAHTAIDSIWNKYRWANRTSVYQSLSAKFGYSFHVGHTRTIEECKQAIKYAVEFGNKKLQERIN